LNPFCLARPLRYASKGPARLIVLFNGVKMDLTKENLQACVCHKPADRYVSFDGIDCDGNARLVMGFIARNIATSDIEQPFWNYFMAKRTPKSGPAPDDLFLVHSHINQIREFFEECGDQEALDLLFKVEEECC
jgi:N(2)-fixation sustaining protein CowN